ncbi:sentrin-specific protease 5-like isoform X2 [Lampris incognitus]|uniref:sentrin-specific protease 5-like isoform X2 n=1 Tax=Lampris incognitus TaxID=2546036 RepID=UPI0024B4A21E|nr:sentrin-specific protease 5-like isoform X2 [Lampris incognitus]
MIKHTLLQEMQIIRQTSSKPRSVTVSHELYISEHTSSSKKNKTYNSVLSSDPPFLTLCSGQTLCDAPTTKPRVQSKDRKRKNGFTSSLDGVSGQSRRSKRHFCCNLKFWMWRMWWRSKRHFWIFKDKKQAKVRRSVVCSSTCSDPNFKIPSQRHKGKFQKHHTQNQERLQEKKSALAVGCDIQGGLVDMLEKEQSFPMLCKLTSPLEPCTHISQLCNHDADRNNGEDNINQNMLRKSSPSQRLTKGGAVHLCGLANKDGGLDEVITIQKMPKKLLPSKGHDSQEQHEPVGSPEQSTMASCQEQCSNKDVSGDITRKNILKRKMSFQRKHQNDVSLKALTREIHEFLDGFYKIHGSFIPLEKTDVFRHLKKKFNTDFSKSTKQQVLSEVISYQTSVAQTSVPSFQVVYKKHTLTLDDLSTLADQNWLNDQVINMYGEMIVESTHQKVHFLNSFFHRQLVTKGYEGVRRWTKQVDLFSKSLLLVPIHLEVHWCLVTVDTANKKDILKYLITEAKEKQQTFQSGWKVSVKEGIPQQTNENDCGVFVLEYCRCLALAKPLNFSQREIPRVRKRIYKELCECKLHK